MEVKETLEDVMSLVIGFVVVFFTFLICDLLFSAARFFYAGEKYFKSRTIRR